MTPSSQNPPLQSGYLFDPPFWSRRSLEKKQIGLQKSCHMLCSNLCGRTEDNSDPGKTLLSFSCHQSKQKQYQPLWLSLVLPLKPSGLPSTSLHPPHLSNVNLYFIKAFLLLMHNSVTHIPLTHTNLTLVGGSAVLRLLVGRYTALYLREQDGDWCQ